MRTGTRRAGRNVDYRRAGGVIWQKAGRPPATYFSGGKLKWMLGNADGLRAGAERADASFGITDSLVLWNLTGGTDGGVPPPLSPEPIKGVDHGNAPGRAGRTVS